MYREILELTRQVKESFFDTDEEITKLAIDDFNKNIIFILIESSTISLKIYLNDPTMYSPESYKIMISENRNIVFNCNFNEYSKDYYFNEAIFNNLRIEESKISSLVQILSAIKVKNYIPEINIAYL